MKFLNLWFTRTKILHDGRWVWREFYSINPPELKKINNENYICPSPDSFFAEDLFSKKLNEDGLKIIAGIAEAFITVLPQKVLAITATDNIIRFSLDRILHNYVLIQLSPYIQNMPVRSLRILQGEYQYNEAINSIRMNNMMRFGSSLLHNIQGLLKRSYYLTNKQVACQFSISFYNKMYVKLLTGEDIFYENPDKTK